ncbi:hypothetical protein GIB67_012043 [Kingdonia uniflora]|uniref:ZF-HD dimerization-type domain-containing protein n=1 Tax=Kingdonia uniflora TaxID=39325 RepID=A0A7J7M0F8_9MAGN|nr:hypothetical protein GIB67_012043 [Kingdonia uniflora]
MDLTTTTTTTTTTTATTTTSPDTDTETPLIKIEQNHHHHNNNNNTTKVLSFSNGTLKQHQHVHQYQHHHHQQQQAMPVVVYKQCRKNHAASLGGQAFDGCGEFMPSPNYTLSDPTSLKCAACGCHRNFHLPDPDETTHIIEYHPLPPPRTRSPNSVSPPPISSSYYPSAPQMLLALSTGKPEHTPASGVGAMVVSVNGGGGRKRFRTKFSQDQKDKMYKFAERVGWKMQKRDEGLVEEFCNEVGVGRGVLKVWMHNNKLTFGKKDVSSGNGNGNGATNNGGGCTTSTTTTSNLHGDHLHVTSNNMSNNNSSNNHVLGLGQVHVHQHHHNGSSSSS